MEGAGEGRSAGVPRKQLGWGSVEIRREKLERWVKEKIRFFFPIFRSSRTRTQEVSYGCGDKVDDVQEGKIRLLLSYYTYIYIYIYYIKK
jgi:hypothetical protein